MFRLRRKVKKPSIELSPQEKKLLEQIDRELFKLVLFVLMGFAFLAPIPLPFISASTSSAVVKNLWFALIWFVIGVIFLTFSIKPKKRTERLVKPLLELDDPRLLATLFRIKLLVNSEVKWQIDQKIIVLLSQLTQEKWEDYRKEEQAALIGALGFLRIKSEPQRTQRAELIVALLKTVQRLKVEKALSAVKALTKDRWVRLNVLEVHAAAQECLAVLENKLTEDENMLLRSANAEDAAKQSLLRPADTDEEAQELLLRVANEGERIDDVQLLHLTNDENQ